ncbi:MAG: AAA family ATPase [Bacteroidetes bacterium]|nr:AAA family ATPase [Bacteroidota bacterium]
MFAKELWIGTLCRPDSCAGNGVNYRMSFIENIEIKNFKSIRHQKIEGCRKINVFIGYPNVGKSNILEALSLMCIANQRFLNLKSICRYDILLNVFFDGNRKEAIEINTDKFQYILKYIDSSSLDYVVREIDQQPLRVDNTILNLRASVGGYFSTVSDTIESIRYTNVKKYQFSENAFDSKGDAVILEMPYGSNLALIVRHNQKLRKECGALLSEYKLQLIFDKNDKIVIQKQLDEFTAFQFSMSQIADTLQRLIFHKAAIESNENAVLLFEEPEAHMFPPYIKKLTTDIITDKTNQFFLATHSPYVLDELILDAGDDLAVYLVDYQNGETIIHHLSSDDLKEVRQYGVDLFFNIESYLKHGQVNNS